MKQPFLPFRHELIVVNFAGGGGACKGIVDAIGRHIDIAINHDPEAIAMHKANHPKTTHYVEDVFTVKPLEVTKGQPVGLAWFSPDCKHFSKAKGGKPVEKKIRGLAWVVLKWARLVAPRVIMLENVEEFQDWGPLDKDNKPCPLRKGRTFRSWRTQLENCGYKLEMREIRASVLGTPTIRKRLYIIARRDGQPIVWPKDTHGAPDSPAVKRRRLKPFRTAAECIDWSLPCPSIFERDRPLAEATLRRIATGIYRYVINCADPFIVPITHTTSDRVHSINDPLRTITTAQRGELALITPYIAGVGGRAGQSRPRSPDEPYHTATSKADAALLTPFLVRTAHGDVDRNGKRRGRGQHAATEPLPTQPASNDFAITIPTLIQTGYGERPGQAPRVPGLEKPLGTAVDGQKHALVAAFLAQHNGGFYKGPGQHPCAPLSTIAGHINKAIVTSNLVKLKGTCRDGQPVEEPIHTIQAGGTHFAEVRAFLINYYSSGSGVTGASLKKPMPTVPTHDRIGLVTIHGVDYAIVDIGMRMLQPRELFRAQGFDDWEDGVKLRVWRDHITRAAEDRAYHERSANAQSATPRSSPESARASTAPVVVSARIDLGHKVLVLRSQGKCLSSAGSAVDGVSFPLAADIVDSARRLAPTDSCADRKAQAGKAEGPPKDSDFTPRENGASYASSFGDEITLHVDDAIGTVRIEIEDTKSITLPAGRRSPQRASILRTLSSYVVHAIASSTRDEIPLHSSFVVDLRINDGYIIDPIVNGKPLTKTAQVRMCGNSVCPPVAEALVRANFRHEERYEAAVA